MLGSTLRNRYQIIKFLVKGGFGYTYLAKDLDLPGHPYCVVKHLQPQDRDPTVLTVARRLFETEAKILYKLGKLQNQIPTLSAHFEERGEFYLVQDFIEGHDLTEELIPGQKLSESYTIKLLYDILEILAVVHQQNVIHRDIKPANLMRREDGKIVLIDFGAVKEINALVAGDRNQRSLTIPIGSQGYMPSEQARGKPQLASDIYAVGAIAIQALTGEHPVNLPDDSQTGELMWRDRTQISDNLANVLDKMVRDRFSERYQNAGEALQAILSFWSPTATDNLALPILSNLAISDLYSPPDAPTLKLPSNTLKTCEFETVTVNSKGETIDRNQGRSQVFLETKVNGITLEMVAIPGGSFIMGSLSAEAQRDNNEGTPRTVNVAPFLMGKYQVTQVQWLAVADLPKIKIDLNPHPSYFKGDDLPVEQVSWDDAIEFCARLSQFTGQNYRLPSEAEWEYACRASTTTPFYFGATITPDLVNYNGNYPYGGAEKGIYREKTTAAGSFPANSFGLYDMHGNVWEWCQDIWHDDYRDAPTDGSAWETDGDGKYRLLRGGSWCYLARDCRAARREKNSPDTRNSYVGFRVACR
ncbi:MAG: bifunctional serine/threonine-protein kinase/formylglycine-generating enzyme family protein [Oscillatoriaceae cyanobacterium Prado104]|jgi:formylglycine-generating enzyme required for sulfatase activity|nr:bifunctional serine/threonine-protein kinase/formylglycine-generating enzyme family protein [Oscillatoriaceae cyanobacterium Prado104]